MKKNQISSFVIVVIIIYLLIPLLATAVYSMFQKWTGILPEGFTLAHYQSLLSNKAFLLNLGSYDLSLYYSDCADRISDFISTFCCHNIFSKI